MRPTYLRLSITDRCDLRCRYCQPRGVPAAEGGRPPPDLEEVLRMVALIAAEAPLRKVRITGGEPLLLPWLPALVSGLRGMLPEATLALTTNGVRLPERAEALRRGGLDRLNISLDAAEEEAFLRVAGRAGLEKVLAGIRAARRAGFRRTRLNTVLLRGLNDDQLVKICRLAAAEQLEARFIELMPLGAGQALHRERFLGAAEAMTRIRARLQHVRHLGREGSADRHLMRDGHRLVTVGFISPISRPFCDNCDRIRLDPAGRLLGCLRDQRGVDLLDAVRGAGGGDALELTRGKVRRLVLGKGRAGDSWPRRSMASIGG